MVFNLPLFVLFFALGAVGMLAGLSPQPWREAHRNQYQVVYVVLLAGFTAVAFATGQEMFVSITFAVITLFISAAFVVSGYVKRSRVSGRAS
jgi:hypothetical protein